MDFAEVRQQNFYAAQLSHFAEEVTIGGPGVDDRTITVKVQRTAANVDGQFIDENMDTLDVLLGRDESHAKGGILNPFDGLWLKRAELIDPGERYGWHGVVLHETPHSFKLRFMRPRMTRLGAKRA